MPDFVEKAEGEYFNNEGDDASRRLVTGSMRIPIGGADGAETSYAVYKKEEEVIAGTNDSLIVEEPHHDNNAVGTEITPVKKSEEEEANITVNVSSSMILEGQDPSYTVYSAKDEVIEGVNDPIFAKANQVDIRVPETTPAEESEAVVSASFLSENQDPYNVYEGKDEIVEVINDAEYIKANHAPVEIKVPVVVVEKEPEIVATVTDDPNEPYHMYSSADKDVVPETFNPVFNRSKSRDDTKVAKIAVTSTDSTTIAATETQESVSTPSVSNNVHKEPSASSAEASSEAVAPVAAAIVTTAAVVAVNENDKAGDNTAKGREVAAESTTTPTKEEALPVTVAVEDSVAEEIREPVLESTTSQATAKTTSEAPVTQIASASSDGSNADNAHHQEPEESVDSRPSESTINSAAFRNISVESTAPDMKELAALAAAATAEEEEAATLLAGFSAPAATQQETTEVAAEAAAPVAAVGDESNNTWVTLRSKRDDRIRVFVNLLLDDTIPMHASGNAVDSEIYTKFSLEKKYFYMKIDNFQEKGDIRKRKEFYLSLDVSVLPAVRTMALQDNDLTHKVLLMRVVWNFQNEHFFLFFSLVFLESIESSSQEIQYGFGCSISY